MIFQLYLQFYFLRQCEVRVYFLRLSLSVVNQDAPIEGVGNQD